MAIHDIRDMLSDNFVASTVADDCLDEAFEMIKINIFRSFTKGKKRLDLCPGEADSYDFD